MKMQDTKIKLFRSFTDIDKNLQKAADVAVFDSLQVKPSERVLIITNPDNETSAVSCALYDAAVKAGAIPVLIFQQEKSQLDFAEEAVINAISSAPDIIISISKEKLGKDKSAVKNPIFYNGKKYDSTFDYLFASKKTRGFWSPGTTVKMFINTVPIDYKRLKIESVKIKEILDSAEKIHIADPLGTDITIGVKNRTAMTDDGDFSKPGEGGNLPAGETFISPELDTAEGVIFFSGSIAACKGDIIIKTPIKAEVKKGFVTKISGKKEAEKLKESIAFGGKNAELFEKEGKLPSGMGSVYAKNARNIGEVGIGLNQRAGITGNMLEDEKAYNTCHIAIGKNYDEDAPSLIHLDGLITRPTITAFYRGGGTVVFIKDGKLTL